jgi:hypothetical protein
MEAAARQLLHEFFKACEIYPPEWTEMPGAALRPPPALIGTDESPAGYSSAGLHSCIARPPLPRLSSESYTAVMPVESRARTRTAATSALTFKTFS